MIFASQKISTASLGVVFYDDVIVYFTTILTSLPLITITLTTFFPSIAVLTLSSPNAASLIASSFKSEVIFILDLILPFTCIAISTSSLTSAFGSKFGQDSLNTEKVFPALIHSSSEK